MTAELAKARSEAEKDRDAALRRRAARWHSRRRRRRPRRALGKKLRRRGKRRRRVRPTSTRRLFETCSRRGSFAEGLPAAQRSETSPSKEESADTRRKRKCLARGARARLKKTERVGGARQHRRARRERNAPPPSGAPTSGPSASARLARAATRATGPATPRRHAACGRQRRRGGRVGGARGAPRKSRAQVLELRAAAARAPALRAGKLAGAREECARRRAPRRRRRGRARAIARRRGGDRARERERAREEALGRCARS